MTEANFQTDEEGKLLCTKCLKYKPAKQFFHPNATTEKNKWFTYCQDCLDEYNKEYYHKNKQALQAKNKKYWAEIKRKVLEAYGNKCACCGEGNPAFLTIDHIKGGGNKQRIQIPASRFYPWLIKNNYPKDDYQILCWNCNMAKRDRGICPHQEEMV